MTDDAISRCMDYMDNVLNNVTADGTLDVYDDDVNTLFTTHYKTLSNIATAVKVWNSKHLQMPTSSYKVFNSASKHLSDDKKHAPDDVRDCWDNIKKAIDDGYVTDLTSSIRDRNDACRDFRNTAKALLRTGDYPRVGNNRHLRVIDDLMDTCDGRIIAAIRAYNSWEALRGDFAVYSEESFEEKIQHQNDEILELTEKKNADENTIQTLTVEFNRLQLESEEQLTIYEHDIDRCTELLAKCKATLAKCQDNPPAPNATPNNSPPAPQEEFECHEVKGQNEQKYITTFIEDKLQKEHGMNVPVEKGKYKYIKIIAGEGKHDEKKTCGYAIYNTIKRQPRSKGEKCYELQWIVSTGKCSPGIILREVEKYLKGKLNGNLRIVLTVLEKVGVPIPSLVEYYSRHGYVLALNTAVEEGTIAYANRLYSAHSTLLVALTNNPSQGHLDYYNGLRHPIYLTKVL